MKENYLKNTKHRRQRNVGVGAPTTRATTHCSNGIELCIWNLEFCNFKQPKTKHRTQSGITLVALVVTVIILLILAGVAISMITGGEGLFSKANNAATKYNQASQNEAEIVDSLLKSEYLLPKTNGIFSAALGMNTPDTSKLPKETTKYVTWINNNDTYDIVENDTQPENWYDYDNGQWANIKTTSIDKSLEAYWVWIPRFAYKIPESNTAKQIEVIFVKNNSNTGANGETCYYSTDTTITSDGSGLYSKKTSEAASKWIIHPAFTFGDEQLNGIWFAKFEASSSNPSANYGGGNVSDLKVQVKPGVTSWRYINLANAWEVCRTMQETGGVIGTAVSRSDTTASIDTHLAKNMDWGAVAALSQSKYGVFNPKSATGLTANGGDNTLRVWNNPNNSFITGTAGNGADIQSIADASCDRYNTENGPKGSSTGTVYGIYDMAGGAFEYVMGIMETSTGSNTPTNSATGLTNTTWPSSKYYDIYDYGTRFYDGDAYGRGKIGDLTSELSPYNSINWNGDQAHLVFTDEPVCIRGGTHAGADYAGAFACDNYTGGPHQIDSFRPVLVCM